MSANGTFSTTLDYDFFAGGYVRTSGEISASFDVSLVSAGEVIIYGQASGDIPYSVQAGVELPSVDATADVSINFSVSSTVDFGVQIFGESEYRNFLDFTQSAEGDVIVKGSLAQTLDFDLSATFNKLSEGESDNNIDFALEASALNYSIHSYSFDGANIARIPSNLSHNDIILVSNSNNVNISRDGTNGVVVLQG